MHAGRYDARGVNLFDALCRRESGLRETPRKRILVDRISIERFSGMLIKDTESFYRITASRARQIGDGEKGAMRDLFEMALGCPQSADGKASAFAETMRSVFRSRIEGDRAVQSVGSGRRKVRLQQVLQ